ncbi:hypothetical protein F5141DRAFT_1074690 [Pisolithus sp. B1]|nr:hypothetical protein F5141DRAFT_1074690 [Pisolithus sp. B1]
MTSKCTSLITDDAGIDTRTLKEVLINESLPTALLEEMGLALGRFLSHLHGSHERRDKLAAFSKLVETRSKEIRSSTAADAMTHGDFWPGNVVVRLRRGVDGKIEALEKLYVLDWEVAKTGLPGLDLGQFCAELYLISRFHPRREESATAVMRSFLSAYRRSTNKVDPTLAGVAVSHIGAHLVTWTPRISWGSREQTRKVVQEGVEMLSLGCAGSTSSLQGSIVEPLLSE